MKNSYMVMHVSQLTHDLRADKSSAADDQNPHVFWLLKRMRTE